MKFTTPERAYSTEISLLMEKRVLPSIMFCTASKFLRQSIMCHADSTIEAKNPNFHGVVGFWHRAFVQELGSVGGLGERSKTGCRQIDVYLELQTWLLF